MSFDFSPRGNTNKTILIVIDGQVDFEDEEGSALPVPGGKRALQRTADYIIRNYASIHAILATRDKHVPNHIAHPVRWVDANGNNPAPYTQITLEQIDAGEYRAADSALQELQRKYVANLEARGEKKLMIWPPHCIFGTYGYEIDPTLKGAYDFWERMTGNCVVYLDKGEHPDTEQYGAFAADVPMLDFPETFMNMKVVTWVNSFGVKVWTGLALSHCVMASADQAFAEAPASDRASNILYLDCTASAAGFEQVSADWVKKQRMAGMRIEDTFEEVT